MFNLQLIKITIKTSSSMMTRGLNHNVEDLLEGEAIEEEFALNPNVESLDVTPIEFILTGNKEDKVNVSQIWIKSLKEEFRGVEETTGDKLESKLLKEEILTENLVFLERDNNTEP